MVRIRLNLLNPTPARKKRSPSGPFGKNTCQARTPCLLRRLRNRVSACMPGPRFAAVPHAGTLLWHGSFASGASGRAASVAAPIRRCDRISCGVCSTLRSSALLAHANAVRSAASSAASTRCLISSATCRWPPASIFDLASAKLRPNAKVDRRVAASRPPLSASRCGTRGPRGGGGGPVPSTRRSSSLPSRARPDTSA